ncbi:hypothetical protein PMI03_00268 [Rhizobium sp. AP16]|nr:hypothetical protein PMI03_00268 [Rhizobium sp. AP16]
MVLRLLAILTMRTGKENTLADAAGVPKNRNGMRGRHRQL